MIQVDNILLVEIYADADIKNMRIDCNEEVKEDKFCTLAIFAKDKSPIKFYELPFGSYEIIGTTDNVSEEMAFNIVERNCVWREFWYRNYESKSDDPYNLETALESYQSWLRANKIPSDKRFAILKLNP